MCGLQAGLFIILLIPIIGRPCSGGCACWAHYQLQIGERYIMPTLCEKPPASCLEDSVCNMQAMFVIWHPVILEAMSSGLQISKSVLLLQPAEASTAWRGSFARPTNPSHPCKSRETSVVWGSIKLATGKELEERERNETEICSQEINQNTCQR